MNRLHRPLLALLVSCIACTGVMAQDFAPLDPPDPQRGSVATEDCLSAEKVRQQFKPISEIKLTLHPANKKRPADCATEVFQGRQAAVAYSSHSLDFHWEPTNFFHRPLYFDDQPLERYGQTVCPRLQPWISGARFVLTLPVVPYKMGYQHSHDCVSVLGYHRPGSCAPCTREVLPWDGEAALWQAASTVGLVFLLP